MYTDFLGNERTYFPLFNTRIKDTGKDNAKTKRTTGISSSNKYRERPMKKDPQKNTKVIKKLIPKLFKSIFITISLKAKRSTQ